MHLQLMKYKGDGRIHKVVCAIDLYVHGGEYTICGNTIPDSTMKYDDCEAVGDEFTGNLKDVTCPNCLNKINFIKSFN